MLNNDQIYIVVDIETDGPVPGLYSMLSIGAVATTANEELSSFYRKVLRVEGATQHFPTMKWWKTQPEAWEEVTSEAQPAEVVIKDFCSWLDSIGKIPVFVAHPVGFDYAFVSWYLWKFANKNPFTTTTGASKTLDLPSFISGRLKLDLNMSERKKLSSPLTTGMPDHSHKAIDDARGFGVILRNVLNS
ncbi:MAG TPA: 3'-5' exoribonuclease [Candidatus Saccharimonadales bacterium]|nr:3'-5' exoribonuclease [Candidatus Saccharimonadales bacterium]